MAKPSFQNYQVVPIGRGVDFIPRAAEPCASRELLLGREVSPLPLFWEEPWMFEAVDVFDGQARDQAVCKLMPA